jgi:hypothetical protein
MGTRHESEGMQQSVSPEHMQKGEGLAGVIFLAVASPFCCFQGLPLCHHSTDMVVQHVGKGAPSSLVLWCTMTTECSSVGTMHGTGTGLGVHLW